MVPSIVKNIHEKGFEIFLDLKFHDIPTTVYKACISAFSLNIWMLNIHLTGGYDMAVSAMKAKKDCQSTSKLIGVSALTSLSDHDCIKDLWLQKNRSTKKIERYWSRS
jgi:orotidine-5'-phosphate decarboxylase